MPNIPTNAWQGAAEGLMNVNQMFNERKRSDQQQEQIEKSINGFVNSDIVFCHFSSS